jgi:DNA polymerase V
MRASGNVMRQHGINDGDLVVIDRSVEPCSGHVVVVAHQGSFLMRPLLRQVRALWRGGACGASPE